MGKRVSIILVLCLAVLLLAVSCDPSSLREELVSVAFDEQSSRAVSASLPGFNTADYYWYYAAVKVDGSNLVTGNTTSYDCAGAVAMRRDGGKGLDIVSGFSQGLWNFTLFAYKEVPATAAAKADFVYSGETTGVLLKSTSGTLDVNKVKVVVSPVSDPLKPGTLLIDVGAIKSASTQIGTITGVCIGYGPVSGGAVTPVSVDGDSHYDSVNKVYRVDVAPGAYLVKVVLQTGETSVSSSVAATVYSYLTTTVDGSVVGNVMSGGS